MDGHAGEFSLATPVEGHPAGTLVQVTVSAAHPSRLALNFSAPPAGSHRVRTIDPRSARILLVEAADRVLTNFAPSLSAKAERSLQRLGVTVLTGRTVIGIDAAGGTLKGRDGGPESIASRAIAWAAGVIASGLAGKLAELTGAEHDRARRITVDSDLTGDMVRARDPGGEPVVLPGFAPVAMQQGRYAAGVVRARLRGREHGAFRYRDKGNLATIGRAAAVADIKGVRLGGFAAWATWLLVHLWYFDKQRAALMWR